MTQAQALSLGTAYTTNRLTADVVAPWAASITRACGQGYGLELHDLDTHAINLRAFLRGAVDAEIARAEIVKAQAVLERMHVALEGC